MQKIKEFLRSKTMRMSMTMCVVAAMLVVGCFAEDGTGGSATATITSAFQSGFSSFASDAINMLGIAVTAAIPLAGVIWLSRKALGWFKSMAK